MLDNREQLAVSLTPATAVGDAELLVVSVGPEWTSADVRRLDRQLNGGLIREVHRQGFQGRDGESCIYQTHGALRVRQIVLTGVDADGGPEVWYRLADSAVNWARDLRASRVAILIGNGLPGPAVLETIVEGLELSSYTFDVLKSHRGDWRLRRVRFLGVAADSLHRAAVERAQAMARATRYARDLVNLPPGIVTPTYLGKEARRMARAQRLVARVLGPAELKRAGMGAILGVAQGSAQPPCFIELRYRPAARPPKHVALVGKGITFDSGGLSIKPADSMQAQKRDMAGGAAVLAVMSVIRDLAPPVEVRGYVPATENMPGGRAIKPGDVVRAYNGKSIEVLNTDAEGRLVLADALSYAVSTRPDVVIDLATLTAAVRTALGNRYAGIMGTEPSLVQALIAAARSCGEYLWELPLVEAYRPDLDSMVADLKNIGDASSGAGTIVGGLFLREFVSRVPWAHIDFSSTVVADKPFPCHPRGATGFGVRLLLRYLQGLQH